MRLKEKSSEMEFSGAFLEIIDVKILYLKKILLDIKWDISYNKCKIKQLKENMKGRDAYVQGCLKRKFSEKQGE